jgi:hypothetical protein
MVGYEEEGKAGVMKDYLLYNAQREREEVSVDLPLHHTYWSASWERRSLQVPTICKSTPTILKNTFSAE